jgi:hypothetical protein
MRASSLGATSSSRSARPEICRSYGAARDLVAIAIKILAPTERKRLDFRHNHPFDAPNAYSRRGQSLLTAYCLLLTSLTPASPFSLNPAAATARAVPSNPLISFQIRPLR